jgi:hypothetical protein
LRREIEQQSGGHRSRHGRILTRAVDDLGNTQPSAISWNAQGDSYNVPVPHPVKVS